MRSQFKKTYYSVTALQDGTIYQAFQTRKPVKSKTWGKPLVDEDGIHTWHFENQKEVRGLTNWGKGVHHTAVVQCLNMKRIIRQRVEERLERIEAQLTAIAEQLNRIEQAAR